MILMSPCRLEYVLVVTRWNFFFFQAEDGIRDLTVTGVQTCALPISSMFFGSDARKHLTGFKKFWRPIRKTLMRSIIYRSLLGSFPIGNMKGFSPLHLDRKSVV